MRRMQKQSRTSTNRDTRQDLTLITMEVATLIALIGFITYYIMSFM